MKFEMWQSKMTGRWAYMSERESDRYDEVKDSTDPKDIEIKELLEQLAMNSWAAHCRETK